MYPMYPKYPPVDLTELFAVVRAGAVTVPPPTCPDCDVPEELTPSGFWYACRVCHPATFSSLAEHV